MAVVLVLMLMGTGVLLKFVYEPLPEKAYESILYLQRDVLFGSLIRNIHHWSIFYRCVPPASPVQLDYWFGTILYSSIFQFYRLSLALGSARLLGSYHLLRHAGVYPRGRQVDSKSDHGWT
ncbi:MAG: hypothetical protein JRE10_00025 [Deltaproteobacteria bacterium]|nr:hypothetical protein [Deltaproteobacteria bacterium]